VADFVGRFCETPGGIVAVLAAASTEPPDQAFDTRNGCEATAGLSNASTTLRDDVPGSHLLRRARLSYAIVRITKQT